MTPRLKQSMGLLIFFGKRCVERKKLEVEDKMKNENKANDEEEKYDLNM